VPVSLMVGSGDSDRAPAPAGPTVTIDSLSELPAGAPPAVDYLLDRTYVFSDGGRVELDVDPGSVLDAAPYPGGVVVAALSSAPVADHLWFTRDGELAHGGCGGEEVVLSRDGSLFAYARTVRGCDSWTRSPVLMWGRTAQMAADPLHVDVLNGQRVEPVGVSTDRLLFNAADSTGRGSPPRVYTIDKAGMPVEVEGIARAAAWDPATSRVAGCPSEGSCVVVDERDGTVQLRLDPGEKPLSFSPDGRYLASVTGQGGRSTTVAIRDSRTGDPVAAVAGAGPAFEGDDSIAWEDSDHVLLAWVDTDGEGLVRLGVDGSAVRATSVTEPTVGGYLLPGS
jgi:hypothetical protein